MLLLGRMHTVLSNSAFSSWASCFLMKVRTEWTASGSATPIMSIISPSPGRVIVFATNSWKSRGHWIEVTLVHSPFPQYIYIFSQKERSHTLSKLESLSMFLSPCTKFGFRTNGLLCWKSATKLSISLRASSCPASQLNRKIIKWISVHQLLNYIKEKEKKGYHSI